MKFHVDINEGRKSDSRISTVVGYKKCSAVTVRRAPTHPLTQMRNLSRFAPNSNFHLQMTEQYTKMEVKPTIAELQRETQRFLHEFIELYQRFPCLWKYSSKDYRNRKVKDCAYAALLEKMREVDPRADKNSVIRKINALRTAFRREFKKVKRAAHAAKSAPGKFNKKPYVSGLWYYDLLKFVVEQQDHTDPVPGPAVRDWNDEDDSMSDNYTTVEDGKIVENAEALMEFLEDTPDAHQTVIKLELSTPSSSRTVSPVPASTAVSTAPTATSTKSATLDLEIDAVYSQKNNIATVTTTSVTTTTSTTSKNNKNNYDDNNSSPSTTTETVTSNRREEAQTSASAAQLPPPPLLWKASKRPLPLTVVQHPEQIEYQEDLDRFGAYVASKLKRSSRKQCIIAEKVIAEVLMRANLGILEETTMITDVKVAPTFH